VTLDRRLDMLRHKWVMSRETPIMEWKGALIRCYNFEQRGLDGIPSQRIHECTQLNQ
jgi:hypothetical protein